MTGSEPQSGTVRAVVVIRTSPPGFKAPYVLAAVMTQKGSSLRRIEAPLGDCPEPGDRVELIGSDLARPLPTRKL